MTHIDVSRQVLRFKGNHDFTGWNGRFQKLSTGATVNHMSWTAIYFVDALAISSFLVSYYWNCYRRGYRIDFWHFFLFLTCVFPNMILLPFATSEMNRLVLGPDFDVVTAAIPRVFFISLVGFCAMLAGGSLWRLQTGIGIRRAAARVVHVLPRLSMMLMSSRRLLVFEALLCGVLQVTVLAIYFAKSGFGFDLRAFTFENPMLRPVAQSASAFSVVIASHCLARYVDRKEKVLLRCTLLLTLGLVFFGARSNLLFIYLNVWLCYLVKLRRRLSLAWLIGAATLMVAAGLYLGNLRAGHYSVTDFFASVAFLLLYGNNFSDLRDFGWVYSGWNHAFWGGKTYLAALFSFIPRVVSHFRDTWGLGVVTASTVGLDPQVHPGLRPGDFGEAFFNFGLPGVVLVGMILGILVKRVDIDVKHAVTRPRPSMMEAFASTQVLQIAGVVAISVNLSTFYVLCGIYLFSWICLEILRITGAIRRPEPKAA